MICRRDGRMIDIRKRAHRLSHREYFSSGKYAADACPTTKYFKELFLKQVHVVG